MDSRRVVPVVGIVSSFAVVAVLVIPYLLVDASSVSVYYGAGVLTPWAGGLLASVAVIVFAAGREERTEPETAAGAGLVFGIVVFAVSALWAVTVPESVPLQLTTDDPLFGALTTGAVVEYHRWLLVVVSAFLPIIGVWYAKTLRLL